MGRIAALHWPQLPGIRIDAGVLPEQDIGVHYDSLLAKIIAWGPSREVARRRLVQALQATTLLGVCTNQRFLIDVLQRPFFVDALTFTTTIEATAWEAPPPPAYLPAAAAAARQALAPPADRAAASGEASPFVSLGAYRGTGAPA